MTTTTSTTPAAPNRLDSISALQSSETCRVAQVHDKVLSSECVYTFHTPFTSPQGIVVNLQSFIGTIDAMAFAGTSSSQSQQEALFVRIVKQRQPKTNNNNNNNNTGDSSTTTTTTTPMEEDNNNNDTTAPTKLALGVPGGFASDDDKYEIVTRHSVVHLQSSKSDSQVPVVVVAEVPYTPATMDDFPLLVRQAVDSVVAHAGYSVQQDVQQFELDAEPIPVSKYAAHLPFVDNGVTISPFARDWKCQKDPSCTTNVWLNLSDGYMGGGRQNWDGSGGSNGALDHYRDTGHKYPLVVKLGTITADWKTADCYSYAPDEDGPVRIPNLAHLLAQRGILVENQQKTVQSTAELEVQLNATYAFDAITEAGATLQRVAGPLQQGLQNLGNSCYLNSVLQALCHMDNFQQRYGSLTSNLTPHALQQTTTPPQALENVLVQTMKVAVALTSGVFGRPLNTNDSDDDDETDPRYRLAPRLLKHCVGRNHVDFATAQQQDAAHFWQYYLQLLEPLEIQQFFSDPKNNRPTSHSLAYGVQHRRVCTVDQKVKYVPSLTTNKPVMAHKETIWSLPIPMELAKLPTTTTTTTTTTSDTPDSKRPKTEDSAEESKNNTTENNSSEDPVPELPLGSILDAWASETTVDNVAWSHLQNAKHPALERLRLLNYPPYLVMQLQRYTHGPDWAPVKLQVAVQVPDIIDLTPYRATTSSSTASSTEVVLPDDDEDENPTAAAAAAAAPPAANAIDEVALSQLMDMGFSLYGCQRALKAVGGSDVEAAMTWVFAHAQDPDFNDPLPEENNNGDPPGAVAGGVDETIVQTLVASLGCFTADQVRFALGETSGQADRAADFLFSHMDDLDTLMIAKQEQKELAANSSTSNLPSSELLAQVSDLPYLDNPDCPTYQLQGMISHIGKHTGSGHYVAHLRVNGEWLIFNDEKVAVSAQPPREHAYLYIWQRTDTIPNNNNNQTSTTT